MELMGTLMHQTKSEWDCPSTKDLVPGCYDIGRVNLRYTGCAVTGTAAEQNPLLQLTHLAALA